MNDSISPVDADIYTRAAIALFEYGTEHGMGDLEFPDRNANNGHPFVEDLAVTVTGAGVVDDLLEKLFPDAPAHESASILYTQGFGNGFLFGLAVADALAKEKHAALADLVADARNRNNQVRDDVEGQAKIICSRDLVARDLTAV